MSKDTRTVKEARCAVIEANGKIEDILNELFREYGVITKGVDIHKLNTVRGDWEVVVQLDASI